MWIEREIDDMSYHLPLRLIISCRNGNGPSDADVERNGLFDPGVGEKYFCRDFCKSGKHMQINIV